MINVENSPVRTSTLFPKHVTFTPRYGQLVLGNTLRLQANSADSDQTPPKRGVLSGSTLLALNLLQLLMLKHGLHKKLGLCLATMLK